MNNPKGQPLQERIAIAGKLREAKRPVAEFVTDEFFRRHPDWLARYGERGRALGVEDAGYHIEFLAGAIECGSPARFEDYARWSSRMLNSRGIDPQFVAENFLQIGAELNRRLLDSSAETVSAYVEAGSVACYDQIARGAQAVEVEEASGGELAQTQRLFLEAILKGLRKAATNLALEALKDGHTISDVYVNVFQESQYQLGRLWETNEITVAEEHMATAITQYVIAQVYPLIKSADTVRGKMVVTGVEGEMHQVGANMVADVLESVGWDVRFLGTNMPHQGILRAVEEHGAGAIGISTTMLFNVPKVIHLVSSLRDRFGTENLRIIVGGAVFRSTPDLYLEIGADDYAPDLGAVLATTWGRA